MPSIRVISVFLMRDCIWSTTAIQILPLRDARPLVVSTARETSLGYISSDSVQGLLRFFTASSEPSTLVSLWKVDGRSTKEFMLAFYDNLAKDLDKAQALRQA